MSDLVKRLRSYGDRNVCEMHEDRDEAADRIEQLERELADVSQLKDSHAEMRSMYFEQLAAEKALADRLADDLKHLTQFHTSARYQGTIADYRKERGL